MGQRFGLKAMIPRGYVTLLSMFLFIISFPGGYSCGETEYEIPGRGAGNDFEGREGIAQVVPSKPDDLFAVLKNGLTLLVHESHASKMVSCQVFIKTGSIFEEDRTGGGLSHYLEHVVSGATTSTLTEAQIKKELQGIGGGANAYTTHDHTCYFINTTKGHYQKALALLLAYITDCQFNETEYQREKKVILQEFQMGENNPSSELWRVFARTAYRNHPVRYPVIGEREIFLQMDKEDLVAHYRRWYTPKNMVISVAGNVDKQEVLKQVIGLTGGLKQTAGFPCVLPSEPAQLTSRKVEKTLPMARLTKAIMGFRTIRLAHPDLYALDVLAVIMGDGRTSRLYQAVRHEKELVLSINAWSWTPTFVEGQFAISMNLSYQNLSQAVDAVWEELSDVRASLVSEEALTRAKNKVVADHIFGRQSAESQASRQASDWLGTGDPYFSEAYVSRIQKVTLEEVRQVARKYFKKNRLTLAVVKPPLVASQSDETKPASTSRGTVERRILPNRMTLLVKRNAALPIVTFKFCVKGGLRFEPVGQPGVSHFTANLLTKGTVDRSKLEIAEALEDVGGSITASSGHNTVGLSVSVLKEHFDLALDVLADVVLHPSFPEDEIEKQRHDTLLAIKKLDEQWTSEITRLFKKHYYRKHPYRNDVLGKAEAVKGFCREDIRDFYDSIMMPNNAVLAVFGDVDPGTVASKVRKVFGDFTPRMLEQPIIEVETQNIIENETFETFNDKTSAGILIGYNGLSLGDPDTAVVDVLDAIVSGIGYPSGWLHDALRGGEKSLVYYVHAYSAFGMDGGYFGIMCQTTPENYEEVLAIVLEQMSLLQQNEVDLKTLRRAKNMSITMHEIRLATVVAQASSAAVNEIAGLGYDYDMKYPELIENVSAADVLRVARELFSHHLIVATKPRDNVSRGVK